MPATKARVRIWGMQANILSVGGYAQIGNPPIVKIWDGNARGWDPDGRKQCKADLDWQSVGGIGVSFHGFSKTAVFNCPPVDCAFSDGDEVVVRMYTFLFFTIYKVKLRFCDTVSSWRPGLGLGLGAQGATWKIENTDNWP